MAKETPTVDAYLKELDPERRAALEQVRALIQKAAPDATESMYHRLPTYHYGGHMLVAFASQKQYMSVYVDVELLEKHKTAFEGLNLGKSCVRFRRIEQLDLKAIERILRESIDKIDELESL